MGTVYILRNKMNNKYYVGQTTQIFKERFRQHQTSHSHIGNALRKYGIANFEKILIKDIPEEKLDDLECEYIKEYNSIFPNGYNWQDGGHKNKHHSEESKRKMKGHTNWLGKHHSKETIEKMKKPKSEDTKKKMSEAQKGNTKWLGKHHSKESIEKMKEVKKGHFVSENTRKKISEVKKGHFVSEETKRKMSESKKGNTNCLGNKNHLGFKHSEETKKRISLKLIGNTNAHRKK